MKNPRFKLVTYYEAESDSFDAIWYSASFFRLDIPDNRIQKDGVIYKVEGYLSMTGLEPKNEIYPLFTASCQYLCVLCDRLEEKYYWKLGELKVASVSSNPKFRPIWEERKVTLWINL